MAIRVLFIKKLYQYIQVEERSFYKSCKLLNLVLSLNMSPVKFEVAHADDNVAKNKYIWQSRVEIEDFSIMYFDCITAVELLSR